MKKIFNKKINLALFVFGLFFTNTNVSSAQVYVNTNQYNYVIPVTVTGPEVNNLPFCDSTYRLNCPYNLRCRNINGMIAYACPAAYVNQPASYYNNANNANYNYNNYSDTNYNNYVNTGYINYSNQNSYVYNNYNNVTSNYKFVNSPVYFENGAYYTNPIQRPYYNINPTHNQTGSYYYYSY